MENKNRTKSKMKIAYIISTLIGPLVPSSSIISRVLDPKFFGKFDTHSVAESALRSNGGDHIESGQVDLNPFGARVCRRQLLVWTPRSTRYFTI